MFSPRIFMTNTPWSIYLFFAFAFPFQKIAREPGLEHVRLLNDGSSTKFETHTHTHTHIHTHTHRPNCRIMILSKFFLAPLRGAAGLSTDGRSCRQRGYLSADIDLGASSRKPPGAVR